MDFRVLGPLTAHEAAVELELGGPKQRLVLAMLLAAHGDTVTTGALIEGLWTDSPPATARKTLQGYVHHLRGEVGDTLVTDKAGYSLHVGADQVDERRFRTAIDGARPLVELDPDQASDRLTEALGLWRGNAYADLDGEPVLRPEITRLGELRVVAIGDRIEAELALGRHETLVGELESLASEYPLQERFRAQHMLALYRSGRHGEALRAYARTRDHFVEEMGIEPSEGLAGLEERILARDASLDIEPASSGGAARAVRGYELREEISTDAAGTLYRGYQRSVGREVAVRVSGPAVADDPGFVARYEEDAARVANLNHPNIVYLQDTWREPGSVYQVMQWIDGVRLEAHLSARRLEPAEALRLLEQIAEALSYAHREGVVHGDLRAGSMILATTGTAYLTDFVVGRPPGTEADDLAALIALAHEMLFGVPPTLDGPSGRYTPPASADRTPELAAVFAVAVDGDGYHHADDVVRAIQDALGDETEPSGDDASLPARSDVRSPYKGLHAFQMTDADDFFGRDDVVGRIHDVLMAHRFVAVVGPSGCGKSSVVKAGVAADLRARDGSLLVTEMYPGAYPFEELEAAMRRISVDYQAISDQLVASERGLARVLKTVLPDDDSELVLVIDQFEELFTMVSSESVRVLFLDSLIEAVSDPRARLRLVITMRADFFDRPLRYPEFGALLEAGLVPVTMPDDAGLVEAIDGPAARVGLGFEPGLVAEIVRDVSDQPGGLPLMQYALTELVRRRRSDVLTLVEYRESGGVLGALGARAEELFGGLGPEGQHAMHQAFLRLVTVDDGAENVRRRVSRAELASLEVDRAALDDGLRRFGAHRLLTFDLDPLSRAPTVEVAHEALLREWDRLAGWVEQHRDHLVTRRRLDASMREWEDSGEQEAYLLGGGRLAQFDGWARDTDLALSSAERAFLLRSRQREDASLQRAASRRRRVMGSLVAAAIVAAGFGVYALVQRGEAADEARVAETARLGNEAGFVSEWNRQLALLMAVETFSRDPGFDGLNALQRVLVDAGSFLGVLAAGNRYDDVRWVTDDRLLAATGAEVHLLDAGTTRATTLPIELTPALGIAGGRDGIRATSPSGLAAVMAGGEALLVDVVTGDVDRFPPADGASAVAISDDSSRIAVGRSDGTLEIFGWPNGERIASVVANPPRSAGDIDFGANVFLDDRASYDFEGVSGIVFDPDGQRIVTAAGVFLRAWDVENLSPVGPETVHAWGADELNLFVAEPHDLWFDDADTDVVVVAGDRFVVRWDSTTGERVSLGTVPSGTTDSGADTRPMIGAAGAGDGRVLVLEDSGLVLRYRIGDLDGASGPPETAGFRFDTQQNTTAAVSLDPGRSRFAVASGDGVVTGALDGTQLLARSVPIGLSTSPSLAGDGSMLAAGLASDGVHDLTSDPAEVVPVDVDVEVGQFAGSAATFRFAPATHADVLLWTSTFMEITNAYDAVSGAYVGDYWGSYVPAWSDDGTRTVRVARAGGTRVEDLTTGTRLYESPEWVRAADFDAAGSRVLMTFVDDDGPSSGRLVDLDSGSEMPLPEMAGGIFAAAFTADERWIVVVGGAGTVQRLDPSTLRPAGDLQDSDLATRMTSPPPQFTSDGRWMFSAGDGVARIWDLGSGRQLGKPFPTEAGGSPYAIPDDGLLRLVTPFEGNALIWNLDTDSWVAVACRAAGRNMTVAEWERFGPRDTQHRATCPTPSDEGALS